MRNMMDNIDEAELLKTYNLDSLEPVVWTDVDHSANAPAGYNAFLGDEPDPLGLHGPLSISKQLTKDQVALVHPSSKTFDPKTFLSLIHPDATFADFHQGNAHLKHSIEQRSEALKILVETNFDKFVAVKATTDGVYREMKEAHDGPLHEVNENGVKQIKSVLAKASAKADQVFMPILENNLKTIKLSSTLGVFERSKFFFNLPGSLGEAIEAGKYEQALRDYKRGKYLMESKPRQLLVAAQSYHAIDDASTSAKIQSKVNAKDARQRRIFAKVWDAVESAMQDMRDRLIAQLREPKRAVEEQEKTIDLLLDLDANHDPVAIFLESQHNHIQSLLQRSFEVGIAKVDAAASVDALIMHDETDRAKDLQACFRQLSKGEGTYDRAMGVPSWKAILDLAKQVSEVLLQTLPSFWKVIANDKLKGRVSPVRAQARAWASESIDSYIDFFVQFFHLTDISLIARKALSSLPSWVPNSSSLTAGQYLKAVLAEFSEAINELQALKIGTTSVRLENLHANMRFRFVEVLCQLWQADANIYHRLEDWTLSPGEEATTVFPGQIAAFQKSNARIAHELATTKQCASGGEESGGQIAPEFLDRVKTTFVDVVYVHLDGIVHLAFSEHNPLSANLDTPRKLLVTPEKNEVVLDAKDLDTRVLLGLTNLAFFSAGIVPLLANVFSELFQSRISDDLRTIAEVSMELDKILFQNYIERKAKIVTAIFERGIQSIQWQSVPKPWGVQPYIYEALLALVQVHAQVRKVAKPLVTRTIKALLEQITEVLLEAFLKINSFGLGGMLQATLEIEFVHQTLALYVSPHAEDSLKQIYETISKKYIRAPGAESDDITLQSELENVKTILVASRKATALEFLCFRKPRDA